MKLLVVDVGHQQGASRRGHARGRRGAPHHREVLPVSRRHPAWWSSTPRHGRGRARRSPPRLAAKPRPVDAVGIANQRASTVVWDRATGQPVGPGFGWQDLRTVIDCLTSPAQGVRLAPNLVATKAAHLLDLADPDRTRDLCIGTVDSWVAWTLTGGPARHRRHQRGALRAAHRRPEPSGTSGCSTPCRIPTACPPRGGRLQRGDRRGHRPARGTADRRHPRVTSRPRCSARAASAPGPGQDHLRHRRHARPVPHDRPRFATQGTGGTFPIVTRSLGGPALGSRGGHARCRHQRRVAARRPADHRRRRRLPRRGGGLCETATAWPTCPPCSASARPPGTTGPGVPCWASPGAAAAHRSCGPSSRASPARRRPGGGGRDRRRPGHPRAARRRRHVREPHLRPGPGQRHAGRSVEVSPEREPPPWAPPTPPGSPWAPGPTRTRSPPPGPRRRGRTGRRGRPRALGRHPPAGRTMAPRAVGHLVLTAHGRRRRTARLDSTPLV
jgi:hypothetical protein